MKRLLLLAIGLLPIELLPIGAAQAKAPDIRCPGDNTVEMRYCASLSLEQSDRQLHQKISKELFNQWQPWLTDTSPRPLATERVSVHWVGREP